MTPFTPCAYCGRNLEIMGGNKDHVVPRQVAKNYQRHHKGQHLPAELRVTVWSCFPCNIRKGTRKLVPMTWADKIPELKELMGGDWRVWDGNPMSPAFREVHIA